MVLLDAPLLCPADQQIILQLRDIIQSTSHEDPAEQALFLDACAKSLLNFREFVASFALTPAVGQTAFILRTRMFVNNARLTTPPSTVFLDLHNFLQEILLARRLLRSHQSSQSDQPAETATAAVAKDFVDVYPPMPLEQAAPVASARQNCEEDFVCVPPAVGSNEIPAPHPIRIPTLSVKVTPPTPDSLDRKGILSPLSVVDGFLSLSLVGNPPSPTHSLPDLKPLNSPTSVATHDVDRRSCIDRPPTPFVHGMIFAPPSTPYSHHQPVIVDAIPERTACAPSRVFRNFVSDWTSSNPKCMNFVVPSRPVSVPSKDPRPARRAPKVPKRKRCYKCGAVNHLISICPFRDSIA